MPGEAREDWAIIRALSAKLGKTLPYDNLAALRAEMYKAAPGLAQLETVAPADKKALDALAKSATGSLEKSRTLRRARIRSRNARALSSDSSAGIRSCTRGRNL